MYSSEPAGAREDAGSSCTSRRTMLCPSRNAATENSTGMVGTRVGRRVRLDQLAAVGEHVVEHRRAADPRQVVVADHPLVVQA